VDTIFLDKICNQIISETMVKNGLVSGPFSYGFLISLSYYSSFFPPTFISHCKEVYSLNDKEIEYVWNNYKKNI